MTSFPLVFFTYFNSKFLVQGTVAINSFLKANPRAIGFVYSDDQFVVDALEARFQGQSVTAINLRDIPNLVKEMETMSDSRNDIELLISLKPFLFLETFMRLPEQAILFYIDADLFFYQSIEVILDEMKGFELLLTKHIFPDSMSESVKYGEINAGLIGARNSPAALEIIADWASKCREWCHLRLEVDRYADQLYLNAYLEDISVKAISSPGVNNGVYYFRQFRSLNQKSNKVLIENSELVCFHFHGIRVTRNFILTGFNRYNYPCNGNRVWRLIYRQYIKQVRLEFEFFKLRVSSELLMSLVFELRQDYRRTLIMWFRRTLVLNRRLWKWSV